MENTIAYVNQAALVMVQHMNRFSAAAEEKLYHISTSITRLETELAIIEGKLSSIPGLDAVLPADTNQVGKPDSSQPTPASNTSVPPVNQMFASYWSRLIKSSLHGNIFLSDFRDDPHTPT